VPAAERQEVSREFTPLENVFSNGVYRYHAADRTGRTTVIIVFPGASAVLLQTAWKDKAARPLIFFADIIK